nr:aminotransferase [Roseospira navarrensis]
MARVESSCRIAPWSPPVKAANSVLSSYGTTIFTVMSQLAQQHDAVNLGQGFPEGLEPPKVLRAAAEAAEAGPHQYPPMMGIPALRQAVAAHDRRFYGLDLDPDAEVMVTSGATEALADCLFGLIEPGDEVVLIEPLYDSYVPIIRRAGGIPRTVRIAPPDWTLPRDDLAAAFSDKTKLIVLNSPMNPSGKVFDSDELAFIADLVERYDTYAVCDEVYEHLVFDGRTHIPLMTLPGMRERCARIGSAGKTFSVTSWKVGYIVAAPALMAPIAKTHQFLTFTTPTCLQTAVAAGLGQDPAVLEQLGPDMAARRDRLADGLRGLGFPVMDCAGTYFLTTDIRGVGFEGTDEEFCRHITAEAGVTAVPFSAFYRDPAAAPRHYARFCFAKLDSALDEAVARLARHFG